MKKSLLFFLIGICLFLFGGCAFYFEVLQFDSIKKVPTYDGKQKTEVLQYQIEETKNYRIYGDGAISLVADDTLEDKIEIRLSYYPVFGKIKTTSITEIEKKETFQSIDFRYQIIDFFPTLRLLYDTILEDVKEKMMHDYSQLLYPTIEVRVPSKYQDNIVIYEREGKNFPFLLEQEF